MKMTMKCGKCGVPLVKTDDTGKKNKPPKIGITNLPWKYRRVCHFPFAKRGNGIFFWYNNNNEFNPDSGLARVCFLLKRCQTINSQVQIEDF